MAIYLNYLLASTKVLTDIRNIPAEKNRTGKHLVFKEISRRYY